jgi:hypothetical protein
MSADRVAIVTDGGAEIESATCPGLSREAAAGSVVNLRLPASDAASYVHGASVDVIRGLL